ncbi:MAG: toxin-antitoxin system YwqK family antitoxin [Bacteroidota bacterium]
MKKSIVFITILFFCLTSCRFEHKIVQETYPDGSPKRICWYQGKGENREMIRETTFYPNKQKQMEGAYKDNERDGKWSYWYENGKLWSEGNFILGKADGKRTAFFENGKVRYEGFYKEDMRVGKWRFYDENGKLLQEADYSAPPAETRH